MIKCFTFFDLIHWAIVSRLKKDGYSYPAWKMSSCGRGGLTIMLVILDRKNNHPCGCWKKTTVALKKNLYYWITVCTKTYTLKQTFLCIIPINKMVEGFEYFLTDGSDKLRLNIHCSNHCCIYVSCTNGENNMLTVIS